VDELGGFDVALRMACTEAGLDPNKPFKVTVFPRPKPLIETLLKREPDSSEPEATVAAVQQVLEKLRPLYKAAAECGLIKEDDILRMPRFEPMW
jgi:hypothetical protein